VSKKAKASPVILNQLRSLVQILRNASSAYDQELHLSSAQVFVLRSLMLKSPLTVNDLADMTRTHQSSVSMVVQKLAIKKYVRVTSSPEDRRKKLVSLSSKGRDILRKLQKTIQENLIRNIDTLSVKEKETLEALLNQVLHGLAGSKRAPAMFLEDN
jgi:DNA-binding MarR family transcriptional regulator